MPLFSRHVDLNWQGSLMEGKGEIKAGTGAFTLPVTFPRRIGEPEGMTSPEELTAAAHAACYAMVINATLGRQNAKAKKTDVVCTVTAEKTDAGITITKSHLKVTVTGLEGMAPSAFADMAKSAEGGCPVSNALRNNVAITVEAHVK